MTSFVVLLRAVNVGSANRITMDRLRTGFVDAGFENAITYIQSGNVLVDSRLEADELSRHVGAAVLAPLGLRVAAVVRSASRLQAIVTANPFLADTSDISMLHVAFLEAEPPPESLEKFLLGASASDDQVAVAGSDVYIKFVHGTARSTLTPAIWKKLGVQATIRNWKVTSALAELAASRTRQA